MRKPGCQQGGDERRDRIVPGKGIGDLEQGRLDELDMQQVPADQHTNGRDQGRDHRCCQASAPEPRGVDDDPLTWDRLRSVRG
jgi:hypothetical protein